MAQFLDQFLLLVSDFTHIFYLLWTLSQEGSTQFMISPGEKDLLLSNIALEFRFKRLLVIFESELEELAF
jgi:hypothetical protein